MSRAWPQASVASWPCPPWASKSNVVPGSSQLETQPQNTPRRARAAYLIVPGSDNKRLTRDRAPPDQRRPASNEMANKTTQDQRRTMQPKVDESNNQPRLRRQRPPPPSSSQRAELLTWHPGVIDDLPITLHWPSAACMRHFCPSFVVGTPRAIVPWIRTHWERAHGQCVQGFNPRMQSARGPLTRLS